MSIDFDKLSVFMRSLTWRRNFQLLALILTILLGIGLYDNRQDIYYGIKVARSPESMVKIKIGKENEQKISSAVSKSELIVAIQVVEADFAKNTKISAFFVTSDPAVQNIYDSYYRNKVGEVPLLSFDEKQNKRMVELVNGNYICVPLKDTIAYKVYAGIDKYSTTMCSISVPPLYGKFSGYITAYLKREPTEEEKDQVKFLLSNLSEAIYDKDIL